MPAEILVALVTGAVTAMITSNQAVSKGIRLQQDILKRGLQAHGKVLRVWQPPLPNAFARVYFEFQPPGSPHMVRTCHIDRRLGELRASRPAIGARVNVQYLPDSPAKAVIAKLVPRFAG